MPFMPALKHLVLAVSLAAAAATATAQPRERSEIPDQYKWDLSSMYASAQAWEADAKRLQALMPKIKTHQGHLGDSGAALLAAIQQYEELNLLMERLYVYAGMKSFEDMRIGDNSARYSRAQALEAELNTLTAFMSPELLAIPETELNRMVASTPGLQVYRHFLDEQVRMRPYTLSEKEESLLAMASDPLGKFSSGFSALENADMVFGKVRTPDGTTVELTKGLYGSALYSDDRAYREAAWKGLFSTYEQFGNTLAANYEGHVKGRIFAARARGFDSALQAATYTNGIPQEVYFNVVKVAREGAPQLQRFLELRRKELGVEQLQVWDMYAPTIENAYGEIDFEEAKNIVAEGLKPLGEDYIALYWKGFDEGWVDAFESAGKRGGAYSWGMYDSKPYLSMNYQGNLNDVSTLAHEYGHSLHSYMARQAQPYLYADYRTFIAEIASMTNEAILFQSMLAHAETPQARAYLLQQYLDEFRGGFFRQASFADFEMQAHAMAERGDALTKDSLNQLYADVFNAYYGDAVVVDPLNASEWSRIPHFMRTDNFYVYQYATSFVAANALARAILEEGEPARERFLEMLRSGSSDYPIELLKKAGVDMTSPEPIYAALGVFEDLVDQLEATLEQI
ncbi:oligoendopeptidase F [Haliea sp. E17]|uniref:oligoendopeptidase F n=1 Tax=Haliea sp. E17 TaxID=3401576 RepID=UPI003AAD79A4